MPAVDMAKAKTNSFYLRETLDVDTVANTEQMDLSIYVDPVNKQGILVKSVDYIWFDKTTFLPVDATADWQVAVQLHDTTLGALVDPENTHMISSASLVSILNSNITSDEDFFPDRLGMSKGEGRIIVNDSLEVASLGSGSTPANLQCCIVMEVQVVKLTEKDYISLALQQVADA